MIPHLHRTAANQPANAKIISMIMHGTEAVQAQVNRSPVGGSGKNSLSVPTPSAGTKRSYCRARIAILVAWWEAPSSNRRPAGGGNLHIQFWVSDVVSDLLKSPPRGKDGESVKRILPLKDSPWQCLSYSAPQYPSQNLSGNSGNVAVFVDLDRSASKTTIFSLPFPRRPGPGQRPPEGAYLLNSNLLTPVPPEPGPPVGLGSHSMPIYLVFKKILLCP